MRDATRWTACSGLVLATAFSFALTGAAFAQTWSKTYGTSGWDNGFFVPDTDPGGTILGYHASGVREIGVGAYDAFLMELDDAGTIVWQQGYQLAGIDLRPFSFTRTDTGDWYSFGANRHPVAMSHEVVILKADPLGNVLWSNSYGDANDDFGVVSTLLNGGLLIQVDKDLGPTSGGNGVWLLEIDGNGNIVWQRTFDGPGNENGTAWEIRGDGYLLGGRTTSFGAGATDSWVVKLDASGNVEWQKAYGTFFDDFALATPLHDADRNSPGGYVITGLSFFGGAGATDTVVVKLDAAGNIEWDNLYGGIASDNLALFWEHDAGGNLTGYFLHGFAQTGPFDTDVVIARLDLAGNIVWQQTIGGTGMDVANLRRADNGDLYLFGTTTSFGAGGMDAWVLRLDAGGNVVWQKAYGGSGDENVGADFVHDTAGNLVGIDVWGLTDSFGGGGFDTWRMRLDPTGNILWQRAYGGPGLDLGSFPLTGSDRITLAGTTQSFGAGNDDLWLARLDAQGRLDDPSCPVIDTTAAAIDTNATVDGTYLIATPAGWSSVDTTAVPTNTSITPRAEVVNVTPGPLVESNACAGSPPGTVAISGLMLRKNGGDVILTWDPSTNADHASYRVRGATTSRPAALPGTFPTDPTFADITASDSDGSATNESMTLTLTTPQGYFLVTDINTGGTEGPSEHYP